MSILLQQESVYANEDLEKYLKFRGDDNQIGVWNGLLNRLFLKGNRVRFSASPPENEDR